MGNVAAANPGDIIYVNSSGGHDSNNGSSWLYAKQSISNAIGTVNTNGTVNVADGQYSGSDNTGITINKNMTIIGESQANTIINGQQSGQTIFTIVSEVNVTIINLTFTNNTATNGGAIYNSGVLTVSNDTFTNNNATEYSSGGAINNQYAMSINNSTFTNNTAYNGGAVYNTGGSPIPVTINNSNFTSNGAINGGSIYNDNGGVLNITNTNFFGNNANHSGGAINTLYALFINNSTFTNNSATEKYGGAIFGNCSSLTIPVTITNTTFINNGATKGGAIYTNINTLTVTGSNFTDNNALNGGAIYNLGSVLNIISSTLTNNTAISGNGGAIYNNGTINETNNIFTNNTANEGGAIFNSGYSVTDNNNTFTNNKGTTYEGGAIYNELDSTLTETNDTFINNTATIWGGAIFNEGFITEISDTFTNNNDAIFNDGSITETTDTFVDNTGAISNNGNLTDTNDTFTNNTATFGGAISNNGNLTDTNDTFTNNTAIDGGGAVTNAGTLIYTNCTFTNNTAGEGGAVDNFKTLTVTNSTFTNNTASEGGAILNSGVLNVFGNTFKNNTATMYGGAIYDVNNHNSVVEFNRIVGNSNYEIFSTGNSLDANLNWWGSNNNPSNYVNSNVTLTSWLVLTINANPITIQCNSNSTIIVNLLHTNNGTIESNSIPDGVPVTFTTNLGSINSSSTLCNGSAQSILNSGLNTGVATVSASVDNQLVSVNVYNIIPTATATPTSGLYNTTQDITLTMNEPGIIYYTTDGTNPTTSSNIYITPINIPANTTTTIEYIAIDTAGNTSPIYTQTYTIDTMPVANFTSNTTNGTAPLNVQFIDKSTGNITSYYWNFGDGNTSTDQNPVYTYNTPGNYNITETVTGPGGNNTQNNIITVNYPTPIASFTANTTSGTAPLNIQFNDQSTGNITEYYWDFGDGNTSTDQNPTHTYNTPGNYTVTETVTGPGGTNSTTSTVNITPDTTAPIANANLASGIFKSNQTVTLSATDNDPNLKIYYTLNGTNPTTSSTIYTGPLTISNEGTTTLEFIAVDTTGNISNTVTQMYTIDTIPPTVTPNTTSGLYNTPQKITLTISKPGTIYYTTDGTTPTNKSNIYTGPINIPANTTTTLEYLAIDTAGNTSPIYTQTYTIDTIPPTVTPNTTSGLYNTPQKITLTISKPGTIYYTTDGTTPTNNNTIYTESIMVNKNTILKYIAIDYFGNTSPVYTQNYTIDNTMPIVTVNVKGGLSQSNKVVVLTMNKLGKIYYTYSGIIPTLNSTLYTKPINITTSTILTYFAIDSANNKSPIYQQIYIIDKTPPKIVRTNPKSYSINVPLTTPLTITFSENILKGTNYNNIYIKNLNTGKLVQITKTISKNILTIKMTKSRLHNDKYIIYIPKDAFKDLAGNLTAANSIKFKTG